MSDIASHLIEQVNTAASQQTPIVIQGNGTKQFMGRAFDNNSNIISTAEHTGILNYEFVELVMTARAGTSLAEIDAALAEHNQILACDPARFNGNATIGGSLATNQSGPGRPWSGSLRDHVLGVNLINGKGEHLHFGGQVMKNVAGYDVSRLQAGAMGTLGLMTEVSFKVLPKPASTMTLSCELSMEDTIQLMNELSGKPKPLSGACWDNGVLRLRLSGAKNAVEGTADKWLSQLSNTNVIADDSAEKFWSSLRDQQNDFFTNREADVPLWRFSLSPTAPVYRQDEPWLIDWAGSQRWLKGNFSHAELQEWAVANGGEAILYRGGDRDSEVFYEPNSVLKKIHENLKHSFDPHNIFNSGRLYGWM